MAFPFYKQLDAMDCGPTCLRMVAKYYGRSYSLEFLRERAFLTRDGVSMLGISSAAEQIGFHTIGVRISFDKLCDSPMPLIVHWNQNHFVVVYKVKKGGEKIYVADPAHGLVCYNKQEFLTCWLSTKTENEDTGIALLLEPTPDFYTHGEDEKVDKTRFAFILKYLKPYHRFIIQLGLGMLLGSMLQLIFPFLTQSIVDFGISNQNLSFVTLVLAAQLTLFISQTAVEFIRNWIMLHISTRINISIISDFLIKLMRLPIGFFDAKMIGDIMQRIGDHSRIQSFLTGSALSTLFSFVNLIIFSIVLAIYNPTILFVFLFASAVYVAWVLVFLRRRRDLDYKRFSQASANQSSLYQLITGMQEIKMNNCERQKRWEWEAIQAKLFRISIKGLALSQTQQAGAFFINETKNIIISFFAAKAVITGDMTLGMMLSVQYIIGQLNSPIGNLIGFIQSAQDAKISLERLGEIHNKEDEEDVNEQKLTLFPDNKDIVVDNLSFKYTGISELVIKDLSLHIPASKVTAIVGMSGSGKTTLIKLMLGFYPPTSGDILLGNISLSAYSNRAWRDKCGAVMQDGYIFSDTIAKNIAVSSDIIDKQRLMNAAKVANIQDFIMSLPLSYNTKIGAEGNGLSQGQKQRILIARAVYKNPEYIFFDEATNALDANNEKAIMENLQEFYKGKTVVVVAHRLSTVKNADQIVVLDQGRIVELGTHTSLVEKKGEYYKLVKNQLELGS